MSIYTKIVSSMVVPVAFVAMVLAPAQASAATTCILKMAGTVNSANQAGSRWTVDANGIATGTLVVTGDENCTQTVTLAAWQAPNADKGQPYDQQKLVGSVTKTLGVGTHTMSIQTPDCFYQLDMVHGANAVGPSGTAAYAVGSLAGSLHGGTKTCEVTPPVTPQPPTTPVTPATVLPNTGVGSNVAVFGAIAAVIGTGFQYSRRLRAARLA